MLKCYSNNATLDPELQKWFLAECAAMNASLLVMYIKDDDVAVLRRSCLLFLIAVVLACCSIVLSLCTLLCA